MELHKCFNQRCMLCVFGCRYKARCGSCCPRTGSLRYFDAVMMLHRVNLDGHWTHQQQFSSPLALLAEVNMPSTYFRFTDTCTTSFTCFKDFLLVLVQALIIIPEIM